MFNHIQHICFLGIGGIGMSALARYYLRRGAAVCGYDRTRSDLTEALQKEGAHVFYEDDPAMIPDGIDLSIYTPAIRKDNICLTHLMQKGIPVMKRAEVLGMITRGIRTIAVAGTHGKTTISCMLAHIMRQAGTPIEALLGGIAANYDTNYLGSEAPEWMVVEADEYDRSFLQLHPDLALITSIDADHLDIYHSTAELKASFRAFANNIKTGGTLLIKEGIEIQPAYQGRQYTYHTDRKADYYTEQYYVSGGNYHGSFAGRLMMSDTILGLPGKHNMENALAAAALAQMAGIQASDIQRGLTSFRGVRRRFEICYRSREVTYIDDYAHHPAEIEACILAARELFPGKRICGVFQPHLYTRTRDLASGFGRSLSMLDDLFMLDIYPAREEPIEGITANWLLSHVPIPRKEWISKDRLTKRINELETDVLITMGAGDIDRMVRPIVEMLKKKYG